MPAALFQASFVGGVAVFKASATAMVVARLSADAMPPIYIGAAVATALLAPVQGAVLRHALPPRSFLLLSVLLTLGLAALADLGSLAAVVVLYLWSEVYATLVSLRFWAAVGETFDPRESKRAFATISGFGMAGCIVGGLVSKLVGERLGAYGFLALAAASMLGCRLLAQRMQRVGGKGLAVRPPGSARAALNLLSKDHYARGVALLAVVLSALNVGADYLFRLRADESRSEAQLAALFGEVSLWVGILATLFQFLLAGRLLSRFGIFRYLLIVPVALLSLTGLSAGMRGLWPAFALKVVETVGNLSVNPTALQLLWAPLPDATRSMARAAIDGFVKKAGLAVGGALLLAFTGVARGPGALALVCVSCVAVIVTVVKLKRLYVEALDARLTRQRWSSAIGEEHDATRVLLAGLGSPAPDRVFVALTLLERRNPQALKPRLGQLLAHADERVRERAVRAAGALGAGELAADLRRLLDDEARRPRYAAVPVLAELDPGADAILRPLLGSEDLGLRGAAIGALLRRELARGQRDGEASQAFDEMLRRGAEAPVPERREAARLLGEVVELPGLRARCAVRLEGYLRDDDPSVRRIAAGAARRARLLSLAPLLVEMLARPSERRAAREALVAYGEEIVPVLASVLDDRRLPPAVRYEVPRLLRYVGSPRAAEVMLFSNIQDDPMLRHRIVHALSRMRRQDPGLPMDKHRVEEAIGRRVDAWVYYDAVARDVATVLPEDALLLRALRDRLEQNIEIVFRLLGLLLSYDTVMRAYQHYQTGGGRERAYALELLENLLPDELRACVLPVLEPVREERHLTQEQLLARLGELATSRDRVLAALAIYTARILMPGAVAFAIPEEESVSEDVVEKVFLIEGVDIFAKSDVDDLMALAAIAREKRFASGDVVYKTGDPGDAVFIIVEGAVRIEKDGREILVLSSTESFGETSLLDGAPRPATAVAARPTRVLWIERHDFLDLVSDRPELLKGVFAAVSRNLRRVIDAAAAGKLGGDRDPGDEGAAA